MDPLTVVGLVSSVLTVALIAVIVVQASSNLFSIALRAREEIHTLLDEVQSTRHALDPIEGHVMNGGVSEDDRRLVLSVIARMRRLEQKLQSELLGILRGKNLDTWSTLTWTFSRGRLRELAVNIGTQKTTLTALQMSILVKEVIDLNKRFSELEEDERLENGQRLENSRINVTLAGDQESGATSSQQSMKRLVPLQVGDAGPSS